MGRLFAIANANPHHRYGCRPDKMYLPYLLHGVLFFFFDITDDIINVLIGELWKSGHDQLVFPVQIYNARVISCVYIPRGIVYIIVQVLPVPFTGNTIQRRTYQLLLYLMAAGTVLKKKPLSTGKGRIFRIAGGGTGKKKING
jgi:hypothetical protein